MSTYLNTRSRLLSLPAELRNRIYEFVLRRTDDMRVDEKLDMIGVSARFLAITETCRQIYTETHLLPFILNTFIIDFSLIRWLRALDVDQREAIASIEISHTLTMSLSHPGGTWHTLPGRQNGGYVGMLLEVLPGLKHLNLAVEITLLTPLGDDGKRMDVKPDQRRIEQTLEPFRATFHGRTNGVLITTTAETLPPCALAACFPPRR
ncbi:hypothetical protein C7974DRAFT_150231 [Boeremia exigua]|uniref:uncharacterized protein n=1 Tax=Boeremia exigua TaxID=749465 RepID=UPI001E8D9262|nr:uncharacterized protein C7974DRAFT_150231 [Boeremia exigua]KAH6637917.1 hypothetical protein C7974DRAFT_150231 [Boeremia exigua]